MIAGISGAALLIFMFFAWWGAPEITIETPIGEVTGGGGASANAWEAASFMDIIWFLTAVTAIAFAITAATAQTVALPVAGSAITTGLGILSTVLILYRLIDPPYDATRKIGVFLGLIAAAGIAYGGWRAMEEEGTSFGGEADRLGDRPAAPTATEPTPAERSDPPPPPPPPSDPGAPPPRT